MKVYHGSNINFDILDLSKSKEKRDFGKGFYTTTLKQQAKDWAGVLFERFGGDGIFVYDFELSFGKHIRLKKFSGLSKQWLEMVKNNRTNGGIQHKFDIVQGAVANDKTNRTIALYVSGILSVEAALTQLKANKYSDQISIHTNKALSNLKLIGKQNYGK
jgi:hypothetical protein